MNTPNRAARVDISDKVPANVTDSNAPADEGGASAKPLTQQPSESASSRSYASQQSGMANVIPSK